MATPKTPHFRYPFRITNTGASVVEQDTFGDVAQCVQIVLSTPLGSRIEVPTYGIPDPVFSVDSQSRQQTMLEAVRKWESRASATIDVTVDNIDQFIHHIRANVVDRPDADFGAALPFVPVAPDDSETSEDESWGSGSWGTGEWGS